MKTQAEAQARAEELADELTGLFGDGWEPDTAKRGHGVWLSLARRGRDGRPGRVTVTYWPHGYMSHRYVVGGVLDTRWRHGRGDTLAEAIENFSAAMRQLLAQITLEIAPLLEIKDDK